MRALSAQHERLAEMFRDHQVALLEGDRARARRSLAGFARGLRAHARHEEETLLPVYEKRVRRSRIGDPDAIREEHRRLDAALEALEARVAGLPEDAGRGRALLDLLEEQYRFKLLLEHHNDREDRSLYPKLDEVCSAEERRALLETAAALEER